MPMSMPHRSALAAGLIARAASGAAWAEVGVTDGPKGVVVNPRNGKAYAAFLALGAVKIIGRDGGVTTLATGANVKSLTLNPKTGPIYAMNRGPGTIPVIDPVSDLVTATLPAERGSLTALNPPTGRRYVSPIPGP